MLIVLRGNSGSGKSTTARLLREAALRRRQGAKIAIVGQDYLRRYILKEKEGAGTDNIDLIEQTVTFALGRGYDAILEGILAADRYGPMLRRLARTPAGSHFYYLDVSFAGTLVRHRSKPNAHEFGEAEMRAWYRENDLLRFTAETVITETSSQQQTVARILAETGL